MRTVDKTAAQWLRDHRLARGMTLSAVAIELGVQLMTVWRWEASRGVPAERLHARIAKVFDTDLRSVRQIFSKQRLID